MLVIVRDPHTELENNQGSLDCFLGGAPCTWLASSWPWWWRLALGPSMAAAAETATGNT